MTEAVVRRIIGDNSVDEVITVGRARIANEAKDALQQLCDAYEIGIDVNQLIFQDVNPPDPVKPSFNDVNEALQEKERKINEAWSEYNQEIPKATGEADQMLRAAEGYATERINNAMGDARPVLGHLPRIRQSARRDAEAALPGDAERGRCPASKRRSSSIRA